MTNCKAILVCFVIFIVTINGERTKDKMYENIDGSSACFRRLNGTHQTGCTSKRPSSVGVIHMVTDLEIDLNFILNDGLVPPYVAVIAIDEFTPKLVERFRKNADRVAGVVLHTNISRPSKLSHETQCPNSQSNLEGSCPSEPWNPWGTALLQSDIPFPVFLVSNLTELEKIENCWQRWNNFSLSEQPDRSLCSLELAAFMFATKNSHTCLRRSASVTTFTPTRFCDPLGSRNIWSTLWPRNNNSLLDVLLVTARLDATSMFYDVTPGADSHLTGLVTLLATAYTLKQMVKEDEQYRRNIMFTLFNGEIYDYIGSQRFVYDILHHDFPMEPNDIIPNLAIGDIKLVVELNQLNPNRNNNIFVHHIDNLNKNEIARFYKTFSKKGQEFGVQVEQVNVNKTKLPPASLHSFLRARKSIQGVVLTNHEKQYSNKYYNSLYDDAENIDYKYQNISEGGTITSNSLQNRIANVSKALASSLYLEATGKEFSNSIETELSIESLVDELFNCYLNTAHCKLFQLLTPKDLLPKSPLPSYVSVHTQSHQLTTLTGLTLAWLTSDHVNRSQDNCTEDTQPSVYQYMWVPDSFTNNKSICMRTTMHFSLALSPAFTIENYDWNSNEYSTWTESVWNEIYMRMFLTPSRRHEIMTISVGTVTLILSFALIYFVHNRADILFPKPNSFTPGTSC